MTVAGDSFRKCITEYLLPEMEDPDMHEMWFQQDWASVHTARVIIEMLRTVFINRLISRFVDVSWAPRSPDSTPLNFFIWGYLKGKVYINRPRDLDELRD